MVMYCAKSKSTCDLLTCLYRCPYSVKAKCTEYTNQWSMIQTYEPEEKYTEKYGIPEKTVPLAFRKRLPRERKPDALADL